MSPPSPQANPSPSLRQQAERMVLDKSTVSLVATDEISPQVMRNMLHELQVHQIELEMQNDELRLAQLQIAAAQERYFDLYDLAPVGYCSVSAHGLILEANFTAATMLNVTRNDLTMQAVTRFILKSDQDSYYRCRKALFEHGLPQECELQMLKKGGDALWVHMKVTAATDATGAPVQRMVLSDITERKQADAVMREKNQELQTAKAAAEKASMAKTHFLSNMSHELRSPLNSILGFAQLMEMGSPPPSPAQKGRIDQILRAGWYLLDLISEILDLTSIEAGELTLSLEPIALSELLLECEGAIAELAGKRNIQLHFAQVSESLFVQADRGRLKQVIVNLLTNAIQYNRVGGTLELTCSPPTNQRLRIAVRDTGEGLPNGEIAHLFQPFNRLGRETTAAEGTGIGLALSKRLVELMGGGIGAHSTVGVGSVFWIELNQCNASQGAMP